MDEKFFNQTAYHGGEMLPLERKKLFEWIIKYKPKTILEVGTGTGGGGLYYMLEALSYSKNDDAVIYTCDPSRGPSSEFLQKYNQAKYYKCNSDVLLKDLLAKNIKFDFIFFDGPNDPNVELNDFKFIEENDMCKENCIFVSHDWHFESPRKHDNALATKAKYLRPYIEKNSNWKLVELLENSKESVGLCCYMKEK